MVFTVISIINLEIRVYRGMCVDYYADVILFKVLDHLEVLLSMGPKTSSSWMLTAEDNCAHSWVCSVSKGACRQMEQHRLPAEYMFCGPERGVFLDVKHE